MTRFDYRLHPVDRVTGGVLTYPWSRAGEALRAFHQFSVAAPDEASTVGLVAQAPDGTPVVAIVVCHSGLPGEAGPLLAPLRALGPLEDTVGPRSYREMQALLDPNFAPGTRSFYWKTSLARGLPEAAIEALLRIGPRLPTPHSVVFLQQLHGAAARVAPDATAFPHRFYNYDFGPLLAWEEPGDAERCIRAAREVWTALGPCYDRAVYLNALGEEGDPRIAQAFGANWPRAVALKEKWDPENVFRRNPNVAPGGAGAGNRGKTAGKAG